MQDTMSVPPRDPADPYPYYAALRAAGAPAQVPPFGAWAVSRYADVQAVLRDHKTFSSTILNGIVGASTVIGSDPPEHTRLRSIVNRAFTTTMVADLEPRIRQITRDLLDAQAGRGEFELVEALAIPVPVIVIAEILGVDPERRGDFKRWSDTLVFSRGTSMDPREREAMQRDMEAFRAYFSGVIEARRAAPRDDLISTLVRAEESDRLSAEEVLGFTLLLLIAGNETTTNLIGNAMLALLDHPDQLRAVQADPSLIPNMIEEALRYDSPVQGIVRLATAEATVAGATVPAGSVVMPLFASANRDEDRFPGGDRFDITRANAKEHLAFGFGAHFCLGAPLARLEARVVFEELLGRYETFRCDHAGFERLQSPILRGLKALPLQVVARS